MVPRIGSGLRRPFPNVLESPTGLPRHLRVSVDLPAQIEAIILQPLLDGFNCRSIYGDPIDGQPVLDRSAMYVGTD